MALNIKNEETDRLVSQLAKLTGESKTEAITKAVRERLARVRSERGGGLSERLMEIGRDAAKRWKDPFRSMTQEQLDDLLYDENGLPK